MSDPTPEERLMRLLRMRDDYAATDHESPAWLVTLGKLDVERAIIMLFREQQKGVGMRTLEQLHNDVLEKQVARTERMSIEEEAKQAKIQADAELYVANTIHPKMKVVEQSIENAMMLGQNSIAVTVQPAGPRGRALMLAVEAELVNAGFRCYKQPVNDWHKNDKVTLTLGVHWDPPKKAEETEFRG